MVETFSWLECGTRFLQKEFKFNEKFMDFLTAWCLFYLAEKIQRDWAKISVWLEQAT